MWRQLIIPGIILCLSSLSFLILASIAPELLKTQLLHYLLAILAFLITWRLGFEFWLRSSAALYLGLIILLIITLFAGPTRGSARWISLGFINIQASQLAVPLVALTATKYLSFCKKVSWRQVANFLGILAAPALLIFLQPDLGTTIIFLLSVGSALFFSPIDLKIIGILGLSALSLSLIAYLFLLQPYQRARLTSFLAAGGGEVDYNARQALIAVGSGGIYGRGLGLGVQSQLRFLPERQTDFVFASLSEETGFIGSFLVLLIYLILIFSLFSLSFTTPNQVSQLFIITIITQLFLQIFINIGMNIGLLPITGITLPLISYGGSSLISISFILGLIQSIPITQKINYKVIK